MSEITGPVNVRYIRANTIKACQAASRVLKNPKTLARQYRILCYGNTTIAR